MEYNEGSERSGCTELCVPHRGSAQPSNLRHSELRGKLNGYGAPSYIGTHRPARSLITPGDKKNPPAIQTDAHVVWALVDDFCRPPTPTASPQKVKVVTANRANDSYGAYLCPSNCAILRTRLQFGVSVAHNTLARTVEIRRGLEFIRVGRRNGECIWRLCRRYLLCVY
jgi:hypothetical protein